MKLNRIMWGIVLLFIGIVLLLENFHIIEFYWRNVWKFWPVFLIIAGINVLFNKQKSPLGGYISAGVLVVMLGIVFYKGQEPPQEKRWIGEDIIDEMDGNPDQHEDRRHTTFSEVFDGDTTKKTILRIVGGGTSFSLDKATDNLVEAEVNGKNGNFSLVKHMTDSVQTLVFKAPEKHGKWPVGSNASEVDFKLNATPVWNILMDMGAGKVDFDLSDYKVRSFAFEGGAVSMDVKFGSLLPVTDVKVKTGMADVEINIPSGSGCRIITNTGLSSKDFTGFTKLENGNYETPNFKTAKNVIFIRLDGGLSNFEVSRH
jgi:hypothetical protein